MGIDSEKASISLLVSHQDQVKRLPPQAIKLAESAFCTNAAYLIEDKIMCFQGHPEFTPEYARGLLERRRDRIDADTCEAAIATYGQPEDGLVVARWLLDFMRSAAQRRSVQ